MSRIGRMPITVPAGVTVNVAEGNVVTVKGPKGELTQSLRPEMIIKQEGTTITVERPSDDKLHRSVHGLTRTLLHNMVIGVTEGFKKELDVKDVVLEQGLYAVNVLLGADVLMGREISHDVEAATVVEHLLKDRRREIHGIGDVILRHIHALGGAKIPGQLRQSVFIVIHRHQGRGLKGQQRLDEAGADGTGSADDEHRLSGDFFAEGVPVGLDVGAEHGHRTLGDVLTDELI